MDESEELANRYLSYLGFKNIKFEPDGNVPPDFLADHTIAVEVRRLNQNQVTGTSFQSLEESAIPLQMRINKLLGSFGPPTSGVSWFVCFSLKRPLPSWRVLGSALRSQLEAFKRNPHNDACKNSMIADGFEIELIPAADPHPTFFVPGGYSDDDSGG